MPAYNEPPTADEQAQGFSGVRAACFRQLPGEPTLFLCEGHGLMVGDATPVLGLLAWCEVCQSIDEERENIARLDCFSAIESLRSICSQPGFRDHGEVAEQLEELVADYGGLSR